MESLRYLPRALGIPQSARLAAWALSVAGDAALSLPREWLARDGASLRTRRRGRALVRLASALGALKGPFVKAGQFAALRHDVVPTPAARALVGLRDRVPPLRFSLVRRALERELGSPLETLFDEFEREPLGAASIAQAHRARLPGGEPVVVKVQYPWLRASLAVDLTLARALVARLARSAAPGLDRERLLDEFAAGLREELDFEREARVAGEIAANLSADPQICVPRVFPSHSGPRVLTMSHHPAVPILDLPGLARLGADPAAVLEVVGRAYAQQVFVDGLFHADPHPGNLFVLDEPGARDKPRVLFVDFGLSRRLAPELRRELRNGIYAVLRRDADAFLAAMERMGMIAPGAGPRVRRSVEEMLGRLGAGDALAVRGSEVVGLKDRAVALLQETEGLQLPMDLLLYAKTMAYVFKLGAELAPQVDLMKVCLPHLLRFLGERD